MSHHLEIDFDMLSGPELRLVCTTTPGSPCRMRPAPADGREDWSCDAVTPPAARDLITVLAESLGVTA